MLSTAQADPTPWLPLPDSDDWVDGKPAADTERANNYYRGRYYDPKIGRFISEDPLPTMAMMAAPPATATSAMVAIAKHTLPQAYAYADNNPSTFVDAFGAVPSRPNQDCSASGPICGGYGPCEPYQGANAGCVCQCMGNDPWSLYVRCCLWNLRQRGWDPDAAHLVCYVLGLRRGSMPGQKLAECIIFCTRTQRSCNPTPCPV